MNWTIDVNKAYVTYPNGAIKDTLDGKQILLKTQLKYIDTKDPISGMTIFRANRFRNRHTM